MPRVAWILLWFALMAAVDAQSVARLDPAQQRLLREVTRELAAAQLLEDEASVRQLARQGIAILGDQAGLPEVADEYRPVPARAQGLLLAEVETAFDPAIPFINRQRWWRVGLDPTQSNHALREVATVVEGCVAAASVSPQRREELLTLAREGGDFLVWSQTQAETGVFPFPACRNGAGRPFEVAETMFRRAEQAGRLHELVHNGWVVEDIEDGGLQFDHGLSGVALLHLFEATQEPRYREAALKGADWAIDRRVVTNWNYNSFSVYLLAEACRVSGDGRYLDAAVRKVRLGVLPGQLTDGPRAGRWGDPHNARPAYHYIMVRSLAALAATLSRDSPELPALVTALRLALSARNPEFARGVMNADSAVEALLVVQALPPQVAASLGDCSTTTALETLERYAAERFRRGDPALSCGAWGQLLRWVGQR